ncbi:MAG TPA: hypothetical protein VKZ87_12175 [Ferrovibrio sp.]|jgi:hypothetical protein|uniref:hypothetical protein n=1 Tax=Ferrovibrio sp. TaxID=1917215 RepID=UPI002B4B6C06|nr:hypothetical protein [Ferrovibrio sp.]HLT78134.1 hypothetical protein [Ferrovibrio sp.]
MEHAPSEHPWLVALEQSALGAAMRQSEWLYPLVEILHILGFAILVGSIVGFDLRILGVNRRLPALVFARHNVPLAMVGFFIAAPMGFLLFATEATSIAVNTAFQIKLALIAAGLLNAGLFHLGPWRDIDHWGQSVTAPGLARVGAVISLLAWTGAIVGGRLIAYL